jgi:branched-chain amino acid transport system substrate-binding protein
MPEADATAACHAFTGDELMKLLKQGTAALLIGLVLGLTLVWAGPASAENLAGRELLLGAIVPSSGPFAEWGRTNILAKTTVPFFKNTFNVRSVAIIYDAKDATASVVGTRIMPAVFKENAITIVNEGDLLSFNTGDLDVSAQVTKMKSLNPDGVLVSADYSQGVTVIREMKRQGLMKPVVGATQLISSAILKAAPEIPIVSPATFYATMKGKRAEAFVAALQPLLRRESGLPAEIEPSMYDANIYEIMNMYIDAVKSTGVTLKGDDLPSDRKKIREHMEQLKGFRGLGGPISFNPDGDAVKAFYIVQGQNGVWETKARGCSGASGC